MGVSLRKDKDSPQQKMIEGVSFELVEDSLMMDDVYLCYLKKQQIRGELLRTVFIDAKLRLDYILRISFIMVKTLSKSKIFLCIKI
jgi:hypothetical protein